MVHVPSVESWDRAQAQGNTEPWTELKDSFEERNDN